MRYFVTFNNENKVSSSWERETAAEHPIYIKDTIHEITEDQYNNLSQLILSGDTISIVKTPNDLKNESKKKGRVLRELSQDILKITAGYCLENSLTPDQVSSLRTNNASIFDLLNASTPITAKPLIDAISPDGTIVKQELLDSINLEYTGYYAKYPDIFT